MERSTNRSCLPSPSTPLHNHDNDETMKRANRLEELRVTHHQTNSVINGRLFSPRFSIGHLHRGILPFPGGPTMRWGLPSAGPILNVQIERLSGGVFCRPK